MFFRFAIDRPIIAAVAILILCLFGLVAVGLGAAVFRLPGVETGLKIVGGLFLLYLAWRIASAPPPGDGIDQQQPPRPIGLVEGFVFQAVNPKAWTYSLSVLSLFTQPGDGYFASAALLTGVVAVCGLISANSWALFGLVIARLLTSPRRHRIFSVTMGLVTAASALLIIV